MSMSVAQAKGIARQWVAEEGIALPGFAGAFLHGSVNWLPDEATLSAASDLDVMVLLADSAPPVKPGKFVYQGVLLEVSYLSSERLQSPESILSDYQMAGSFRAPGILADPTGQLSRVQAEVARHYAQRDWVRKRCEDVRRKIERDLQGTHEDRIFPEQVLAWLFGTGKTAHLPLVAGLKNPTVRRRYVAAREVLDEYGYLDVYEDLLGLLGCGDMSSAQVAAHLDALTPVFDATGPRIQSPVFFASDLSAVSRPLAIGGSRALIEGGLQREAVFWIAVTYARCLQVLHHDAPDLYDPFMPGFHRLLDDLGIRSDADIAAHNAQTLAFLPRLWAVSEAILAANPAVEV